MTFPDDLGVTWLGHAAFKIRTPGDKILLVDPWISNPACPENGKSFDRVDAILVTHGHYDHLGNAVEIGRRHEPEVVGAFEVCLYLESQGVPNLRPMNKGGTQTIAGNVAVTMVHADHSSGIRDGARVLYGGEAAGYVITLESGFRVYHAGDTNVFGDMRLIHELYAPELALLPIGGLFTMSPREAALACELLRPHWVLPMHYGTFPPLTGRPAELRELLGGSLGTSGIEVLELAPGDTLGR